MKSRIVFISAALTLLLSSGAQGREDRRNWLIGPYIAPSRVFDVLDLTVSAKPSPSSTSGEFNDALALFSNRARALETLNRLRQGGRIFAGFEYSRHGELLVRCGRTRSWSRDWDEISENAGQGRGEWNSLVDGGTFDNFKYVGREERVYAIARCLSGLSNMPALRPRHPAPAALYIDPLVYQDAVRWFSSFDAPAIRGTTDQYKTLFRCLVSESAKTLNGPGSQIVVRRLDETHGGEMIPYATVSEHPVNGTTTQYHVGNVLNGTAGTLTPEVRMRSYILAATSTRAAVDRIMSRDEAEELSGLWPMSYGINRLTVEGTRGPIEAMIGADTLRDKMRGCRMTAGLFVLPQTRVTSVTGAAGCASTH